MGLKVPEVRVYGQNDEVSPECAHVYVREVVARYPHGHVSKLTTVAAPHLAQREQSPDILNDTGFTRFLGDYDRNGVLRAAIVMRHVGGPETVIKRVLISVKRVLISVKRVLIPVKQCKTGTKPSKTV